MTTTNDTADEPLGHWYAIGFAYDAPMLYQWIWIPRGHEDKKPEWAGDKPVDRPPPPKPDMIAMDRGMRMATVNTLKWIDGKDERIAELEEQVRDLGGDPDAAE